MNYNQQNNYNPSTICERCGYDTGANGGVCPNCKTTHLSEIELNKKAISNIKLLDLLSIIIIIVTIISSIYYFSIASDYGVNAITIILPIVLSGVILAALLKFCSLVLIYLKKIARK